MFNKYLNQLVNYEDEAVLLSHSNYLMNTDIDCFHLNTKDDPVDIMSNFMNKYSPVINAVPYFKYLTQMIKGDYLDLPLYYGIYEAKLGLIIGFNSDHFNYKIDEYDEYFHITALNGLLNCDFILSNLSETVEDILTSLDEDIERILIHDYLEIANTIKIKVNLNRSLAEIEKGITDSVTNTIKQLMKAKHLNPYL